MGSQTMEGSHQWSSQSGEQCGVKQLVASRQPVVGGQVVRQSAGKPVCRAAEF